MEQLRTLDDFLTEIRRLETYWWDPVYGTDYKESPLTMPIVMPTSEDAKESDP